MAIMIADTACVDPRAEIAEDVEIGPYCVVGPHVRIGRGTRLIAHVCILNQTTIGENNVFHPFVTLGDDPQDLSFRGSDTRLEIGNGNILREGVTVHRGTEKEDGLTRMGHNNYLMAYSHVAHDCKLGDSIMMANGSVLAGHCHVESFAAISGLVAVHHFVTVGGYCFVGGHTRIYHDVPPFMLVEGHPAKVRCINLVGLRRRGFERKDIAALREAHRLLYRGKMPVKDAASMLEASGQMSPAARRLIDFVQEQQLGKHGRARERFRNQASASPEDGDEE
jgi:UDP-N-acetylglucosamine acyltransferase